MALFSPPLKAEREFLRRGLARPTPEAARFLLGKRLVWRFRDALRSVRVLEVEAYLPEGDPAAHARAGRTGRTAPLFGPPGTAYVFLAYGIHHCLNVAVEPEGVPGCVLVRAARFERDPERSPRILDGPGRLARGLGVDRGFSGADLLSGRERIWLRDGPAPLLVDVTPRVGLARGADLLLRFVERGSLAPRRPAILPGEGFGR